MVVHGIVTPGAPQITRSRGSLVPRLIVFLFFFAKIYNGRRKISWCPTSKKKNRLENEARAAPHLNNLRS